MVVVDNACYLIEILSYHLLNLLPYVSVCLFFLFYYTYNITMRHIATVIQLNGFNQLTTAQLRWKM